MQSKDMGIFSRMESNEVDVISVDAFIFPVSWKISVGSYFVFAGVLIFLCFRSGCAKNNIE